jgi:hypothetical protein
VLDDGCDDRWRSESRADAGEPVVGLETTSHFSVHASDLQSRSSRPLARRGCRRMKRGSPSPTLCTPPVTVTMPEKGTRSISRPPSSLDNPDLVPPRDSTRTSSGLRWIVQDGLPESFRPQPGAPKPSNATNALSLSSELPIGQLSLLSRA